MNNNPVPKLSLRIDPTRLAALLATARANNPNLASREGSMPERYQIPETSPHANNRDISTISNTANSDRLSGEQPIAAQATGRTGEAITYNTEQQRAVDLMASGASIVMIGAAGTGKTTCTQGGILRLIQSEKAGLLDSLDHKYLSSGTPGIVVIAFTRRAVNNIRRVMPENMKNNCITFHKLMEYEPEFFEIPDPVSGELKKTMRFATTRDAARPLPNSIHTIFIEECSMFSCEYHSELLDACPHKPQIVYLGDIQQLPPVFGSAILGYKMLELPTIELTTVYRQALESPIIRLAHRILSGKTIPSNEFPEWQIPQKLTIHPWKKKLHADIALATVAKFFKTLYNEKLYDPEDDMILIPFNKSCGTDELNKHVAQHIARSHMRMVYEIVAGFNKHYYSVGDRVLYDKEDAQITGIRANRTYTGKSAQAPDLLLDYWGHNHSVSPKSDDLAMNDLDLDIMMQNMANISDEDRVRQASHIITVHLLDSDRTLDIDSAAGINSLLLSYALTVHKSQGSEWKKVFLILHQSHATMLSRELLYTAVTRAKEELYIICEPESMINGIRSQRIKGNTLAEKCEYFKGKQENS